MLSPKPWKADAILRLFVSVLLCMFMGTLVVAALDFHREPGAGHPVLFFGALAGAFCLFGAAVVLLGREWRLENFVRGFALVLGCTYGGLLLSWAAMRWRGAAAAPNATVLRTVVAVLSLQGAGLLLIQRFLREHALGWAEAFGFNRDWKRAALLGVLMSFVVLPAGWGLQDVSARLLERVNVRPREQLPVKALRAANSWADRAALAVAAILIAPAAEEMLFRGILYPAIKRRGFPRLAFWGTSALFGAIHLDLVIFVPLMFLAVVLTWLYEKTDNLLAPIATHSCFNALNFLALYLAPWLAHEFNHRGAS